MIINVIVVFFVGIVIGYFFRNHTKVLHFVTWAIQGVIFILLFLLGFSIGRNKRIFDNLGSIGLKSLFFSLGAILGSIILLKIFWKWIFRYEK